jgi:hypothetical protein
MYPVFRFHLLYDARIAKDEAEDAALRAEGFITADELDALPRRPEAPAGAPSALHLAAAEAANAYWQDGKATKFELYVIGLGLGAPVDLGMTAAALKAAVESFRPAEG